MQPLLLWKSSITYPECVPVALGIQNKICMRHIVICGLTGSTIFFQISHKRQDFRKMLTEHKIFALIFSTTFV